VAEEAAAACRESGLALWSPGGEEQWEGRKEIEPGWVLASPGESSCTAWSPSTGLTTLPCAKPAPALCARDLTSSLVFPQPDEVVRIVPTSTAIRFLREAKDEGWQLNYTMDMWPSTEEAARSARGVPTAASPLQQEVTGLSPDTAYTVVMETSLGLGISHQSLMRGVRLAREVSAASPLVGIGELTEDGFFLLKLVFFSVVIGIFAFTAILFLLSQTL